MDYQVFQHSKFLNNIPIKKLEIKNNEVKSNTELDDKIKVLKIKALNRFYESNIPVEYWDVSIKNFPGNKLIVSTFDDYTRDLNKSYIEGRSICLCGTHGVGKTTLLSSILKVATIKDYSCLYTTLSDIVNAITSNSEEKSIIKKELNTVDFLVIDEFDSRFIGSENAGDLFARTLENIFRTRSQNKLPTLLATNSPNVLSIFSGQLKASLDSLFSGYIESITILGKDLRG